MHIPVTATSKQRRFLTLLEGGSTMARTFLAASFSATIILGFCLVAARVSADCGVWDCDETNCIRDSSSGNPCIKWGAAHALYVWSLNSKGGSVDGAVGLTSLLSCSTCSEECDQLPSTCDENGGCGSCIVVMNVPNTYCMAIH